MKEKRSQKQLAARALACGASLMLLAALRPATARAVGPSAVAPYSFSTFAMSENGYSKPDSITFSRSNIFVGYGNGGNADGSGGAMSTIVKYKMDGTVVKTYTVVGHNDGLRYNAQTGDLWAVQNEDANATLSRENQLKKEYILRLERNKEEQELEIRRKLKFVKPSEKVFMKRPE